VEGDLQEEFDHQVQHAGLRQAQLDYIRNVFGFIRPFAIKRKPPFTSTRFLSMNMMKHYLIVAVRNLVRQKAFSAINIAGLALGMTCCLFILLWVHDELSIDNFHSNGENLYNVYQTVNTNNVVTGSYATAIRYKDGKGYLPIEEAKQAVPEIERITFYATGYELPWGYPETFQVGDRIHKLEGSRAGEDFLTMFSYPVIAGNKKTALKGISGIALSRKMAVMFFDTPENAIGKSIRYENRLDFVVTAVFEDVPVQSSLKFDFLINWESQMTNRVDWASPNVLTTIQLAANADVQVVESKINRTVQSHMNQNDPRKITHGLQPFRDQYLVANFVNGKPEGGRVEYIRIFGGVAIFILVIACINFMNLATARSIKRAKEIGVRKVVGSSRASLIAQFFGESVILSLIALILSLGLLHLLLPSLNMFTQKQMTLPIADPASWIILAGLVLFTGLVSGSYPALFLSALKPVRILKGAIRFSNGSIWFRKGLAVFQFVISIALLIVTIVISQQTGYVQHTHLGYDRENLIYMRIEGELMNAADEPKNYRKYSLFKEKARGWR
jgi:ABC-type antimicrobial peptide transport system permease subunit